MADTKGFLLEDSQQLGTKFFPEKGSRAGITVSIQAPLQSARFPALSQGSYFFLIIVYQLILSTLAIHIMKSYRIRFSELLIWVSNPILWIHP
jgi:hypothetical protein